MELELAIPIVLSSVGLYATQAKQFGENDT